MKECRVPVLLLSCCWFLSGWVQAVTVEVKEGNSTCIKAELSASFSVTYNTSSNTSTASFPLPSSSSVDAGSSGCGGGGGGAGGGAEAWLVLVFGAGHALGLSFSSSGTTYRVDNLTLQYNLSDGSAFPDASSSDVVTVVSSSVAIAASINTTYRCFSPVSVSVGAAAAVTFTDVRLQAFMQGDDLSPTESVCTADQSTTAPPTAPPTTTAGTTVAPPTPPGTPEQGRYLVYNSSGSVCLLAAMGLQLNVSYDSASQNKTVQDLINWNPSLTNVSGSCEAGSATLSLTQEQTATLNLTFSLNSTTNRYRLSAMSLLARPPAAAAPVRASNSSLDYLRSSLGRSYMCNAEQTLSVSPSFSLNTFRLQVQPFAVTTDQFATAEECQVDQDQMLIPIIVGAALAGLVLIVLIAYLVGRKRSHAGYQTI